MRESKDSAGRTVALSSVAELNPELNPELKAGR
jgi:hypothetical protein